MNLPVWPCMEEMHMSEKIFNLLLNCLTLYQYTYEHKSVEFLQSVESP